MLFTTASISHFRSHNKFSFAYKQLAVPIVISHISFDLLVFTSSHTRKKDGMKYLAAAIEHSTTQSSQRTSSSSSSSSLPPPSQKTNFTSLITKSDLVSDYFIWAYDSLPISDVMLEWKRKTRRKTIVETSKQIRMVEKWTVIVSRFSYCNHKKGGTEQAWQVATWLLA